MAFQLSPSAPRTFGTASSSSPTPVSRNHKAEFPTPSASSYGSSGNGSGNNTESRGRPSLGAMARHGLWPTPTVNGNWSYEGVSPTAGVGLETAVAKAEGTWDPERQPKRREPQEEPPTAPALWPTPVLNDAKNDGGPGQFRRNSIPLNAAVKMWPTPRAAESSHGPDYAISDREGSGGDSLVTAVARQQWPTPQSRDYRTGTANRYKGEESQGGRRSNLNDAVTREEWVASSDDPPMSTPEAGGQLNPTWVEWLMAFPAGWTACGPWGTQLSLL